jgi:putative oxidoreductase
MDKLSKLLEKNQDIPYFVFRVLVGLIFLLHGIMKVQMYSAGKLEIMSLMGLAMILELVIGVLIIIGLFTRYASIIGAVEMLVAYFMAHISKEGVLVLNLLKNGGEPALLFFAAFLVLLGFGARIWSLDKIMNR